ncbi:hypothetical protein HNQ59_000528 [Chitinivorax tropicus]|uniref:Uncharacterized protein n=1 Tax=Chitinivorax tropicus TaxID=714531 RepID=A0A840MD78_9PROT|nr:hypothetical protein [Chitinivorax tropicus]
MQGLCKPPNASSRQMDMAGRPHHRIQLPTYQRLTQPHFICSGRLFKNPQRFQFACSISLERISHIIHFTLISRLLTSARYVSVFI